MTKTETNPLKMTGDLSALFEASRQCVAPDFLHNNAGDIIAVAVPQSVRIESWKPYADQFLVAPSRAKGFARFDALSDFIDYSQKFERAGSVVFVQSQFDAFKLSAQLVIDYSTRNAADWHEWGATYETSASLELKEWLRFSGKFVSQAEFARFLEDRILDVSFPHDDDCCSEIMVKFKEVTGSVVASPSQLIALSRGLQVTDQAKVSQFLNLSTGETVMHFTSEHGGADGAKLQIPNLFQIAVPLFKGEEPISLPVRLRYRVKEGSVVFAVDLYGLHPAFEASANDMIQKIAFKTALSVWNGVPDKTKMV
jgi:uncharacterized protein YfdQ (DUF2303 family)